MSGGRCGELAHPWDQASLHSCLWESDLRVGVFPMEYNVRSRERLQLLKHWKVAPKILHLPEFKDALGISGEKERRLPRGSRSHGQLARLRAIRKRLRRRVRSSIRRLRRNLVYGRLQAASEISWLARRFQADRFEALANTRRWVFMVGCNNSGTTLLHELLAAHPDVGSMPREGQQLTATAPRPGASGMSRVWSEDMARYRRTEQDDLAGRARLVHDWVRHMDDRDTPVYLVKSPVNSLRTRWLQRLFPRACFVAIVRDGRAVAEGIHRRKKRVSIERGASHWAQVNATLLEDADRIDRFEWVRYEDLVANPEAVVTRLLRSLDLDPDRYDFDFRGKLAVHNIDERPSEIRNFNAASLERIPPEVLARVDAVVAPVMDRLGYESVRSGDAPGSE